MKKIGLVLEGGASRGVYTAGVLDCFMEENIKFPYIVGVSAGACNGADYVSWQIGRTRKTMIQKDKKYQYMGMRTLLRKKQLMDMDMIFDAFPNQYFPFDYDTYFASNMEIEYGCTDCETGQTVFLSEKKNPQRLMQVLKASCAMPGAVYPVELDGKYYIDGGVSDSIPVQHALDMGCDKVVVIQTRSRGFSMKSERFTKLIAKLYHKYPAVQTAILKRPLVYNKNLIAIRRLEAEGKVFVIRPEIQEVKRTEKDFYKLMRFYHHGYEQARHQLDTLRAFMAEEETHCN